MGQAFDEDGNVLGEAFGNTKREVFDKLMKEHGEKAHEFRIRKLRESVDVLRDAKELKKGDGELRKEIENAINRCCAENVSNTPDFILAEFLTGCLAAFDTAVQQRETWYGRDGRPAETIPVGHERSQDVDVPA